MCLRLLLLLACCLAGCATEHERSPPPAAATPELRAAPPTPLDTTASDSADTTDAAWTDRPVEVERPTDEATLRAVRSATHDGFDRVVFEFAEAALPSYRIAFAEAPIRQCGSGNPVALEGEQRLGVHFSRTRAHTEEGRPTVADRTRTPALPRLRALTLTCDFEGVVTWVLGLGTRGSYRVTELSDPTRLVVDVRR